MNYTYIFPGFTDDLQDVRVVYHDGQKEYLIQAFVNDSDLVNKTRANHLPSICADLIDLAMAIYTADWLSPRKQRQSHNIEIELPLRHPEIFDAHSLKSCLQDVLKWYTRDNWYFQFRIRSALARSSELTQKLPLELKTQPTEVALWSGGLDSLAGLCNRLWQEPEMSYTLFGTGSKRAAQGNQKNIAEIVSNNFRSRIKLIQLPIEVRYPSGHPPINDMFRVRGFVFKLLGAVCAYLEDQQNLYVYENGFGAINLPYRLSELGLSHTRSVNPISLIKTEEFISQILEMKFRCSNPFLFWSKGQMCEILPKINLTQLAYATVTCDSCYRQANQPSQCGYCSSCILRRLALSAAGIEDFTKYVVTHGDIKIQKKHKLHFEAMKGQVRQLKIILSSEHPWYNLLNRYPELRIIGSSISKQKNICQNVIQEELLDLYRLHIKEWQQFENNFRWERQSSNPMETYKQLSLMWQEVNDGQ